PPVTNLGGLLALQSTIGRQSRDRGAVIPEFGVQVGYQLTRHLRAYAGYTLIYWGEVARAGDQIDLTVNPNLLPPATPPGTGPFGPGCPRRSPAPSVRPPGSRTPASGPRESTWGWSCGFEGAEAGGQRLTGVRARPGRAAGGSALLLPAGRSDTRSAPPSACSSSEKGPPRRGPGG